jgi:hypothetical protein
MMVQGLRVSSEAIPGLASYVMLAMNAREMMADERWIFGEI